MKDRQLKNLYEILTKLKKIKSPFFTVLVKSCSRSKVGIGCSLKIHA